MLSTCRKTLLAMAVLSSTTQAKDLGSLESISKDQSAVTITTKDKEKVVITLLKGNVLRLQAGVDSQLIEAKNKAASIVVEQNHTSVNYKLSQKDNYQLLTTDQLALRIYPEPLRFEAYRPDNRTRFSKNSNQLI
jgi:high-affinity Fe2+/Pb2+ permease